jgi:hypothetical protein
MYSWKHIKENKYHLIAEKNIAGRRIRKTKLVTTEEATPSKLNKLAHEFESSVFPYLLVETYRDLPILKYAHEHGYRVDFGAKRSEEVEHIDAAKALVDLHLTV